jgi:predicted PurR-regulated permease PerM
MLDSRRRAASLVLAILGIGLVAALLPYASGLLAAPVLYILWVPLQRRLIRVIPAPVAAGVILVFNLLLIVLPGIWLFGLLVGQAQAAAQALLRSPLLARLDLVRFGPIAVGPAMLQLGQNLLAWFGSNAFSFLGAAMRFALNLVFTLFGLYYLLVNPGDAWKALTPFIPFTPERTALLRARFEAITYSTVIGTGLVAVIQGILVGLAFAVTGIPNSAFWGAVMVVLSVLPVVGSGLLLGPAALSMLLSGRYGAALFLVAWGLVVVGNVELILRPLIYRRYAHVHPMITLVGALVGVEFIGLVGLVLGPLAIQYFFELIRMFREEHAVGWLDAGPPPAGQPGVDI